MSASIASSRTCAARGARGDVPGAVDAERGRVAVPVDHVVDGLEQHAELLAERPPWRLVGLGDVGDPQPQPDGRREQTSRLGPVKVFERHVGPRDVEVLPPIIPSAASATSRAGSGRSYRARGAAPRRGGRRREERDALTERDVRARTPAALVVVVHRGQVVVDEREAVHQLERECRPGASSTVPPAASAVSRAPAGSVSRPPPSA